MLHTARPGKPDASSRPAPAAPADFLSCQPRTLRIPNTHRARTQHAQLAAPPYDTPLARDWWPPVRRYCLSAGNPLWDGARDNGKPTPPEARACVSLSPPPHAFLMLFGILPGILPGDPAP
ncbi:hypothetical protein CERSUDRAFT_98358 [Gelatoporia subvermispora B]|uniref:Uncharacterized protein n=1 Tax=Ceriporiopsis subvermispora (strain B) TaxID=914234 RepID=M2QNS5_CERS8|nr:hypothetical protein CERSUDRAFT_98358 [Gelatoporia subvermispora B]